MNGNILSQRFNYFTIIPYKDYCTIPDVNILPSSSDKGNSLVSHEEKLSLTHPSRLSLFIHHKIKGKRNGKTIYCEESETQFDVDLKPFLNPNSWFTQSERQLKRHYNRLLSSVQTNLIERTITLNEDVLTFRLNRYRKFRDINCKYFKKTSFTTGVKINLKTGNILIYRTNGGNKNAKNNTFRQNSFPYLFDILKLISDFSELSEDTRILKEYFTEINSNEFLNKLYETISKLNDFDFDPFKDYTIDDIFSGLVKLFVNLKKIKIPDNYENYLVNWYPTQKYLKKNDNKLILAILDRLNLKTKSFNKLFNTHPNVNINSLIGLCQMFGYKTLNKYLPNLNEKFYINDSPSRVTNETYISKEFDYGLNNNEKNRLLKLLNSYFETTHKKTIVDFFHELQDHIMMIKRIRDVFPDTELRAQNVIDFENEHIELSKTERLIKKGYVIQHTYETKLIKCVEETMQVLLNNLEFTSFYPVILKTEDEYTEEGAHMHHCVAGYVDRENSIIISIRKDDVMGNERVTCEFNAKTKELVQAKYFCNGKPPEVFNLPLKTLISRIKSYKGIISPIGTKRIPLVINGVEMELKPTPKTLFETIFAGIELNNEPFF
jgi:hypothetical protein